MKTNPLHEQAKARLNEVKKNRAALLSRAKAKQTSTPSETESSPFVPSTEGEIANAFVLGAILLEALRKDQEENPEERE